MSTSELVELIERQKITAYDVHRSGDVVRIVVEGDEDAAFFVRVVGDWLASHGEISVGQPTDAAFSALPGHDRHRRVDLMARRRLGDRDVVFMIEVKQSRRTDREVASYDADVVLWARAQAALIREGHWEHIDAENVAEEIEDLSKREHRELRNRIRVLMMHLLKWHYQPDRRSGSWIATIIEQRAQIQDLMSDSPSLRTVLEAYAASTYETARDEAVAETGLSKDIFPAEIPFTVDELLTVQLRDE